MVRTMNLQQRQQRISSMHGCPRGPRIPDQVGQPEFWPEPSRPGQAQKFEPRTILVNPLDKEPPPQGQVRKAPQTSG